MYKTISMRQSRMGRRLRFKRSELDEWACSGKSTFYKE
ncbi:hypothetical protein HMPREF1152_0197 [Mogibacterium sp. CM50]|uniref:Uncharacterized protein n=1 Tax=Mogibacterium timidum ATCC 33093 TaxID=1401079 RepID=X8ISE6_9FIRM|nr:hypothetical protein HMPREF1152_0197 [Mogibacterium sp. CM50]EUC52109.1 hypothetical protein HMPREF0581_0254 [Mogibacterium timidum ATCC 33093]